MIAFPNAKINIGLSVINKRTDGYHNLKSLFYPIPLYDALEIIVNKNINSPIIKTYGNNINCAPEDNICIKAFNVLKEKYDIPFVEIYLYKSIPHGAGLGGGSSNGASMIVMLNNTFNLNLNEKEMIELASTVGSDCPFFIYNRPMLAEGRGEVLSPFSIDLSGNFLVLIKPNTPLFGELQT